MHDHDFEEQVHIKMADLEIRPSESVWKEVDNRLHTREKQRRWAILLPLLSLLLGISGYLLYGVFFPASTNSRKVVHQQSNKTQRPLVPVYKPTIQGTRRQNNNESGNGHARDPLDITAPAKKEGDAYGKPGKGLNRSTLQKAYNKNITPQQRPTTEGRAPLLTHDKEQDGFVKNDALLKKERLVVTDLTVTKEEAGIQIGEEVYSKDSTSESHDAPEAKAPAPSTISAAILSAEIEINTRLATKSGVMNPAVTAVRLPIKSGWQWGIYFQAGRSGSNNSLDKSVFNSAVSQSNFAGTTGIMYPESKSKPGLGFSTGVALTKKISRRVGFSLGLDYTLLTTTISVGSRIDTPSNAQQAPPADRNANEILYRGGNSNRYTNKYHFIGLPVIFKAQLNRKQALPLYWNAGISLSRLIGGNALHYDYTAQTYFKDNKLINKTQLAVLTSLSMRFFAKHRFQLEAGPQVQYGLTKLLQKEKHMLFAGIKAEVVLKKK